MKNYKIIFYDGTTEYVNRQTYFKLLKDSGNPVIKSFILHNNRYAYTDIKRMVEPKDEACGFDFNKLVKNRTPERRKKALKAMIKGLEGYIKSDRYQGTDKPKELLEAMQKRYSEDNEVVKT